MCQLGTFNRPHEDQLTASRASLIGVLVPVLGAGASALLLGERITRLAAFGGVLAIAGVALAARKENKPSGENGEPGTHSIVAYPVGPEAPEGLQLEQRKAS